MKNITALTILVIIINTPIATKSILGQEKEKNYHFSIGTQFGLVHGQSMEVVYPTYTKGELLSELQWDMKPVFYYGAQAEFSRVDPMKGIGFFSMISYKSGVTGDSGIMEDRDWESMENDALTKYSKHTNKTRELHWLDAAIGVSFPVKSYFYITPFLSGTWMHFSFTARDIYLKYARVKTSNLLTGAGETFYPIDDDPDEVSLTGDDIRYSQDWLLIAAGFTIGRKLSADFNFDLTFQITPFTVCLATDEHLATKHTYVDYTHQGLFLEPRGKITYTLRQLEFSLELAWRYIGLTRGETYIKVGDGDYFYSENEAGAGLSFMDTCFGVRIRL
ncbi:MAG: omptin family outer membrane protease [Treponema sp.]|nr:omptin family outer membrane protease [Treponema sp.]